MIATVLNDNIRFMNGDTLDFEFFVTLTGKHIDWQARTGEFIEFDRFKGKLIVKDHVFHIRAIYKKDGLNYICVGKAKEGGYILTATDPNIQSIITSSTPSDWELT
jgi:hypothetical protein